MSGYEINHRVWGEAWKTWALCMGLTIATGVVMYVVQPSFLHMENASVRASQSYITTQQGLLRQFKASYDGLDTRLAETPNDESHLPQRRALQNQQRAIVLQMRQAADLIPGHVPDDIREFLSSTR